MQVKNNTDHDFWFGPLLVPANATSITIDDTSDTSLYLTNDAVADAINNLAALGSITVTSPGPAYPRATGTPQILHGDGSPEGIVYAGQGSLYMRRDSSGSNSLYTKTTGSTLATGWQIYTTGSGAAPARKTTSKAVTNTVTDTDLLNGEITIAANAMGLSSLLRLTAWGDWLQNAGSFALPTFSLKLGGTTLLKTGAPSSSSASASRGGWRLTCEIMNLGAANAQLASMDGGITCPAVSGAGVSAFATGEGNTAVFAQGGVGQGRIVGYSSGAIDTTAPCGLALSVINGTASASYETKLYGALVEII